MRKDLTIAALLCLGTAATGQTQLGRNHRAVHATPHGTSAIEFDLDQEAVREGAVEIDLQLPDRFAPIRLDRRELEARADGNWVWRGSADRRTDSEAMLTFYEGYVAGTIRMGLDLYEVRPGPNGHVVEKIDPTAYPACGGTAEAPAAEGGGAADRAGFALDRVNKFAAAAPAAPSAAGVYTVDLLSVYTPQARAAAGGAAQITAVIQAAVDAANQAFLNSGVNMTYRLVRTAEAAHNDAGDLNADLAWLTSDAATAAIRDQSGADLVSLVVENGGGYCGMGYAMRAPGPNFAGAAFQVTARGCAVGNLTLAHEHGHNIGLEHDPSNGPAPGSASYPWSFGYLVNGVFRTVMSYSTNCPNGCTRMPYFSNPNVSYRGYPTGVAETNDNARTANLTAPIVAAFRSAPSSPPPAAPAAPTGLAVTAVTANQISLAWVDQAGDESGFRVERSQNGGGFGLVAVLGANVSTYVSTGLAAATPYSYRVRSYSSAGDSANSNTASATTQSLPTPTAPSGLSATAVSAAQINLGWGDLSSDESGFRIERSSGGGSFVEIATAGAGVATYSSTGLTAGTAYSFRVRAYNGNGNSGYSNTAAATTQTLATAPGAPSGLAASAAGASQINLTWADGSSDESGFRIERSTDGGAFGEIGTAGAGVTSYSNSGLTGGTAYSYRVRAYNGNGNSGYSNTATATTQAAASAPPAPTGFSGTPSFWGSGASRLLVSNRLNWTDGTGETAYRIEKCKATGLTAACTYAAFRSVAANSKTTSDNNVFNVKGIYKYRIRAENATGNSAWTEATVDAR